MDKFFGKKNGNEHLKVENRALSERSSQSSLDDQERKQKKESVMRTYRKQMSSTKEKATTKKDKQKYSLSNGIKDTKAAFSKAHRTGKDDKKTFKEKILAALAAAGTLFYVIFRTIWRVFVYIAVSAAACLTVAALGIGVLFAATVGEVPELQDCTLIAMPQDSAIYDRDGEVIGVITTSYRIPVTYNQISQAARDAIVSIEDERFYNHEGIDFWGIARALKANFDSWRSGGSITSQGASTITQQYVRNAYSNVGTDQTISRKLTEMMLAAELESTMSKDDILTSYMNTIGYGDGCYGIEAASQHFFGHSASTLDYYEAALLAAVINAPSKYNLADEEGRAAAVERAKTVLDQMYSLGKLGDMTQEELRELKASDVNEYLHITERERVINEPYYYDYVMSELLKTYTEEEIASGGWQIYTTLSIADGQAARECIADVESSLSGITGAIVDIDVKTGAINAFCGGTDYESSQYNIATQSKLQTGSCLKPILYAALCEYDGYYMTDTMSCTAINIAGEGEEEHYITPYISGGSATLEQGIIQSDNAMAIHAANELGMEKMDKMMQAVGFTNHIEDNTVAVIGGQTEGFTPIEMATGYATLANNGTKNSTWCIKNITDNFGNTVYEHEEDSSYAMSSEVAAQVTHSMEKAVEEAGWYNISFDSAGWNIAAKTGTTNDDADAWCCGFDTTRAFAVWLGGHDEKTTVPGGSSRSCSVINQYLYKVAQSDAKEKFTSPQYKTTIPKVSEEQDASEYIEQVSSIQLTPKVSYAKPTSSKQEGSIIEVKGQETLVARGTEVEITVAKDSVIVPNFVNMSLSDVYAHAEGLNIVYDVKTSTSGSTTPKITAQSIEAGENAIEGETVVLTIEILVPSADNTITQTPVKATDSVLAQLTQERDSLKESNGYLSYEVEYWKEQAAGTGKTTIPNIAGLTIKEATTVLESLGLNTTYAAASSEEVVSTSPAIGTQVEKGTSVRLYSSGDQTSNSNYNSNANRN